MKTQIAKIFICLPPNNIYYLLLKEGMLMM